MTVCEKKNDAYCFADKKKQVKAIIIDEIKLLFQ